MAELDSLTCSTVDRLAILDRWLDPAGTAVLVVDMQEEFTHPESNVRRWFAEQAGTGIEFPPYNSQAPTRPGDPNLDEIPALRALLEQCRKLGVCIVWTPTRLTEETDSRWWKTVGVRNCYRGEWTEEISAGLEPQPEDLIVHKTRHSAFFNTGLANVLGERGIRTVAVTGRATGGCVEGTCRDAMAHDFGVVLVEDCVGPPGETHVADVYKVGLLFGLPATSLEIIDLLAAKRL